MIPLVEKETPLFYWLKTGNEYLSKNLCPELSESLGVKLDVSQRYPPINLLRNPNPPKLY